MFCGFNAHSNNIQVTNVSLLTGANSIKFDLSWENSWRSNVLNNWDAAWVFIKYFDPQFQNWRPVKFTGFNDIISPDYDVSRPPDGLGVFIYRYFPGGGSNTITNIELGITPQQATGIYDLKVFAIEMVYVPEAAFYAGDGVSGYSYKTQFNFSSPGFNQGYPLDQITDEMCAPLGGSLSLVSADFPNGFNDFYYMKYELSQGGYRDFLNTLSYSQQVNHVTALTGATPGTAALSNSARNYIKIVSPGNPLANIPAVFGCDADGDNIYDEATDGEWVACNFLNWPDEAAYLCWAGLRPITELEFEKAARGIQVPVPLEAAWGTVTTGNLAYLLVNPSQSSETVSVIAPNQAGNVNYQVTTPLAQYSGPMRNGIFATSTSNRITSGGGFYGNMELSGNLWERVVTTATTQGLAFRGSHGHGWLSQSGWPVLLEDWPGYNIVTSSIDGSVNATGLIKRGGSWETPYADLCINLRTLSHLIIDPDYTRRPGFGCRGGRTAP